MNKFKNWFRIKLKQFLDIDDIESNFRDHEVFNNIRFNDMEYDLSKTKYKIEVTDHKLEVYSKNTNSRISHFQDSVDAIHRTVENVVHIGTDVYKSDQGHSWAVVCVEGKMNLVKFVDLNRQDGRDVLNFLKQFEAGRHCIDTPYKELFYDGLFKF